MKAASKHNLLICGAHSQGKQAQKAKVDVGRNRRKNDVFSYLLSSRGGIVPWLLNVRTIVGMHTWAVVMRRHQHLHTHRQKHTYHTHARAHTHTHTHTHTHKFLTCKVEATSSILLGFLNRLATARFWFCRPFPKAFWNLETCIRMCVM
jgi:hypothetical protein